MHRTPEVTPVEVISKGLTSISTTVYNGVRSIVMIPFQLFSHNNNSNSSSDKTQESGEVSQNRGSINNSRASIGGGGGKMSTRTGLSERSSLMLSDFWV